MSGQLEDKELDTGLMALDPFEVHTRLGREWAVLDVRGELDILTSPDLAAILEAITPDRTQMVVDLTGVRFVDAHGLRVLTDQAGRMQGRGRFVVACPPRVLRRLLAVTGLESAIELRAHRPAVPAYHAQLRL